MTRIIKLIEEKLASDECTIYVLKNEIEELKRKLAEAENKIEEQSHLLMGEPMNAHDLKGENE
jgi:peptidoglycan hydrolase CwlO-like protein